MSVYCQNVLIHLISSAYCYSSCKETVFTTVFCFIKTCRTLHAKAMEELDVEQFSRLHIEPPPQAAKNDAESSAKNTVASENTGDRENIIDHQQMETDKPETQSKLKTHSGDVEKRDSKPVLSADNIKLEKDLENNSKQTVPSAESSLPGKTQDGSTAVRKSQEGSSSENSSSTRKTGRRLKYKYDESLEESSAAWTDLRHQTVKLISVDESVRLMEDQKKQQMVRAITFKSMGAGRKGCLG